MSASRVPDMVSRSLQSSLMLIQLLRWSNTAALASVEQSQTEQNQIIFEIQDESGEVGRDETRPDRPVIRVRLAGLRVDDAALKRLKCFPRLRELSFSSYFVTDAGLAHLEGLADLEVLRFRSHSVTGSGLASIARLPRLRTLEFSGDHLRASSLVHLTGAHGAKVSHALSRAAQ
jgi:hypothetical protein